MESHGTKAALVRRMVNAAQLSGNSQAQLAARKRLVELEPDEPQHWNDYGEYLRTFQGAETALKTLEPAPSVPSIILLRSALTVEMGQRATAIAILEEGLRSHPGHAEMQRRLERYRRQRPR